jgi:hypothetical protein
MPDWIGETIVTIINVVAGLAIALGFVLALEAVRRLGHRSRSMFQRSHATNSAPIRLQVRNTSRSG